MSCRSILKCRCFSNRAKRAAPCTVRILIQMSSNLKGETLSTFQISNTKLILNLSIQLVQAMLSLLASLLVCWKDSTHSNLWSLPAKQPSLRSQDMALDQPCPPGMRSTSSLAREIESFRCRACIDIENCVLFIDFGGPHIIKQYSY